MNQSFHQYYKVLTALFLSASIIACSRDGANEPSPADHIARSERLTVPAAINLPANTPNGNKRVATLYATGVQQYKAKEKAGSSPVAYEWALVAPKATLFNTSNQQVGSHGAGPFWKVAADSIFAQHFSPARTAPSPDGNSIDWLLLMPKTGTSPGGVFSNVAYIQRIATKGGKPPATPPTGANQTVEVAYEAVYRFTKMD